MKTKIILFLPSDDDAGMQPAALRTQVVSRRQHPAIWYKSHCFMDTYSVHTCFDLFYIEKIAWRTSEKVH